MYQVLARKYRPRNFNELVGQNHVSRALTSALERGRLHHAYLFTGTRGVGKTTFLLQFAKDHFEPSDRRCLYINFNNFYL